MSGLVRAEWLRLRKRRSLQVIVLAVPALAAFFFLAGFASIYEPPTFDAAEARVRYMAEGFLEGVPPDEAEAFIAELLASERESYAMMQEQVAIERERYAFPQSILTVLGSGTLLFFALILLTATTIGDEFGWGTVRTALLASSDRRRMLLVRLGALGLIAVLVLGAMLILGIILPALLAATGAQLPSAKPIDVGALGVLLLSDVVIAFTVIAFAALATLTVRSGSLTLIVMLVYVAIEAAILALLLRFETFQDGGTGVWALDLLPVRGIGALTAAASRAASGLPSYMGEEVIRNLGAAGLPILALLVYATVFATSAIRRFSRMDIVE